MATQAYGAEMQAVPQASQPPQAPTQARLPPPPPVAAAAAAAATPQPQYVTELQNPQPQAQPPGSQKQYVTELSAAPAPPQAAGAPTPAAASQQYIVVTVAGKCACARWGGFREAWGILEAVRGRVCRPPVGRLLVQAKPGHVSPLQLTNIQVPQQALSTQRLVVQSAAPGSKGGQVSLTVHGTQQVHSPPERSPVQTNSSSGKTAGAPAGAVPPQLQIHGVQQSVPVTQEVPGQGAPPGLVSIQSISVAAGGGKGAGG
uniref:Uncharacterized protein n=1 Tax=Oryctolagus cuniculus TaxID=9986 RepID=G1TZE4_RABIT